MLALRFWTICTLPNIACPALGAMLIISSENIRAIRANSKAKPSDQQNKYIFASQTARARHVAHTLHPQPHTS
jgi:hypothetical protein